MNNLKNKFLVFITLLGISSYQISIFSQEATEETETNIVTHDELEELGAPKEVTIPQETTEAHIDLEDIVAHKPEADIEFEEELVEMPTTEHHGVLAQEQDTDLNEEEIK